MSKSEAAEHDDMSPAIPSHQLAAAFTPERRLVDLVSHDQAKKGKTARANP